MNKYKTIWSPKSKKDLHNIYTYIAYSLKETSIAHHIVKKLLNSISRLACFPERYPKIFYYTNKSKNLRKLLFDKYLILYEIDNISRENLHFTHISL